MELQPSTAPLPPLLAEVRRRHPDVDIVVLPDDEPTTTDRPRSREVDDTDVTEALRQVDRVAGDLQELVGCALPASVLRHGPFPGSIRARTHCSPARTDGAELLARLEGHLAGQGWQVHRPSGDLDRVVAHGEGLEVRASWAVATGAFLLEVSSAPLPVGEQRVRVLVRA